ncbi:ribosome-binding factor A [Candidatus Uhrbacteria bacterium]|nr:ribosome-binding factor A [Candidatus Uhrbacteria bacterium]
MPSLRLEKVNELLKTEVGSIILRELEMPHGVLPTITRVESEADLKTAKIFFRAYPEDHGLGVRDYLRKHAGVIQHALNRRLAMRFVPQISFYIDAKKDNPDDMNDVEKILDSLQE